MARSAAQTQLFGDLKTARKLPKSCSVCHGCEKTVAVLPNAKEEPAYTEAAILIGKERRDLYWCHACTDNPKVDIPEDGTAMRYDALGRIVRCDPMTPHRKHRPRRRILLQTPSQAQMSLAMKVA